jgi:LysM repeat protein
MSTYQIKSGDTLSEIAARFHTSVAALAHLNHIANPNVIFAGRRLQIPGRGDGFHPPAKPPPAGTGHPTSGVHGSPALANASRQVAAMLPGSGYCARGVELAIQKLTGWRPYANANGLDEVLASSGRFKEVHMTLAQALKVPGLVLTWEHSYGSAAGARFGHTAITWGDGHTSSSDFVESNTMAHNRTGLRIFMPV